MMLARFLIGMTIAAIIIAGGFIYAKFKFAPKPIPDEQLITEMENKGILLKLDRTDSLTGIDNNNNGIRDDIETYIAKNYSAEMQAPARQFAKAVGLTLFVTNKQEAKAASLKTGRAIDCLFLIGKDLSPPLQHYKIIDEIIAITSNTRERLLARGRYSELMSGEVISF